MNISLYFHFQARTIRLEVSWKGADLSGIRLCGMIEVMLAPSCCRFFVALFAWYVKIWMTSDKIFRFHSR